MAKGTQVAQVDPNMPQLSGKLAAYFEAEENIAPKQTVPSLSYGGKVWTISMNGEDHVIKRKTEDGDMEPVTSMNVIVLNYAKRRGRAYYLGAYDPEKPGMPACWSDDGIRPSTRVPADTKQHATCDGCAMSVKGSKITENQKEVTACSQHRMLAVIPANRLTFEPLRMKIAITSDWDGRSPDHEAENRYAFSNYLDVLYARMPTFKHTARVVTKMTFDPNVTFPKVLFTNTRWTTEEELTILAEHMEANKDKISDLINGSFTPNGKDGEPAAEIAGPAPKTAPAQTPAQKAAAAAKVAADIAAKAAAAEKAEAARLAAIEAAKPKETAAQKAARVAKEAYEEALAAAAAEEAGETEEVVPDTSAEDGGFVIGDEETVVKVAPAKAAAAPAKAPAKAAAAPAKAPAKAAANGAGSAPVPKNVAALLGDWGEGS